MLIDQKTFYLSVKTQVKSHTFNRTFFDHPRLKNCCLYLCLNLKKHHLTCPNYLFNLEFPTKLQAEGLKLSGPLLFFKAWTCKLGDGTAPHSSLARSVHGLGRWTAVLCREKETSPRQKQPYARVHSSKKLCRISAPLSLGYLYAVYNLHSCVLQSKA